MIIEYIHKVNENKKNRQKYCERQNNHLIKSSIFKNKHSNDKDPLESSDTNDLNTRGY